MRIVVAIEASEKIDKNLVSTDVVIFEPCQGNYLYSSPHSIVCNTNLSNQGDRCDRSRLEKKAAGEGLRDRADVDLSFFN